MFQVRLSCFKFNFLNKQQICYFTNKINFFLAKKRFLFKKELQFCMQIPEIRKNKEIKPNKCTFGD